MFGPTDVTVVFGRRGTGKSTVSRRISSIYPRRVVFDSLREWDDEEGAIHVSSFQEFAAAWRECFSRPRFTLVFQFELGASLESATAEFNSVLSSAYRSQFDTGCSGGGLCVVIEEVQRFASPHRMEPWLSESVFTGRHAGLALVCNSQRPASVHKGLISQAAHVLVGSLSEPNDVLYLREAIGDQAVSEVMRLPKGEFIWVQTDERIARKINAFT